MISFEHVCFSYGRTPLISDLTLSLRERQVTAVVGPNGCGKSTLIKLSSRLLRPQQGRILLAGRDISLMRPREFAKRAGLLMQHHPSPSLSVEEVVASGRYPYHKFAGSVRRDDPKVEEAIRRAFLSPLRKKPVSRLSGGERQRVFLAMVLAQDTDVIFLDEPTSMLDMSVSCEIMEMLRSLSRDLGKTVVMVLHDLSLALHYADSILVMQNGGVIADSSPTALVDSNVIGRVFHMNTHVFRSGEKRFYAFDRLERD